MLQREARSSVWALHESFAGDSAGGREASESRVLQREDTRGRQHATIKRAEELDAMRRRLIHRCRRSGEMLCAPVLLLCVRIAHTDDVDKN